MKTQNGSRFMLTVLAHHDLLVECLAEEGKRGAVDACTRLDNMRHKFLLRFLVKILEGLAAVFNVP